MLFYNKYFYDKNLVIMNYKISIIAISVIFSFYACQHKRNNYLKSNIICSYKVSYKKDSIIVNTINSDNTYLRLYFLNGEYYCNDDGKLFLSTSKDTSFETLDECHFKYITLIKKCRKEMYSTSKFRVFPDGSNMFIFTYYYNANYKIIGIKKNMFVDFIE